MIQAILILCAVIALVGVMVKCHKPVLYLYKAAVFMLFLPGLFFALFFTLMGYGKQALNIDLYPWREYVMWRLFFAAGITVILFVVSQIPLLLIRQFSKKEKLRIVKIEGLIYFGLLAAGTGLCYYAVQDHDYYENKIVADISNYYKEHGYYPENLNRIDLPNDSTDVRYSHDYKSFTLLIKNGNGEFIYDSRNRLWDEVLEGESGLDRLIAMPKDSDDIIFSNHESVVSFGVSDAEFFQLTQSQYDRAREILIQYFTDSISPSVNGEYLIEHPGGWLEYTAYPYDRYRRQYFGWKDSEGVPYAYIILVSKELIERDITNGYLNSDREFVWIEDGGSDGVDVLINLNENKLEIFGVHQHG